MQWVKDYQLFLFDFDGVLVNTEEIHFCAYKELCRRFGFTVKWSLSDYFEAAHYDTDGLERNTCLEFPEIKEIGWAEFYKDKRKIFVEFLEKGGVSLMPGVENLLATLEKENIKSCVVTHSPKELIESVKEKLPILKTIPNWLTRHDYSKPKPDPEPYLIAIERFAEEGDNIIGFEDSPRGLQALQETPAKAVLIGSNYKNINKIMKEDTEHFDSFEDVELCLKIT